MYIAVSRCVCIDYLGHYPPIACLDGEGLKLSWLTKHYNEQNEEDMYDDVIIKHARAYILQFMGGIMFQNKANNRVHLMFLPLLADLQPERACSWGLTVLAHMYRQLCRATDKDLQEISGALLLLQL